MWCCRTWRRTPPAIARPIISRSWGWSRPRPNSPARCWRRAARSSPRCCRAGPKRRCSPTSSARLPASSTSSPPPAGPIPPSSLCSRADSAEAERLSDKGMRGQGRLIAGYLAVAAASLWLRSAIPVWAIVAPHDDFLFVRLAYNLGGGLWLGQFDNLTLAKGMAYPAFILAAFLAGIPLKIAEQSAYLAAAGLRSEEHTSELQSRGHLVCRLLLEK